MPVALGNGRACRVAALGHRGQFPVPIAVAASCIAWAASSGVASPMVICSSCSLIALATSLQVEMAGGVLASLSCSPKTGHARVVGELRIAPRLLDGREDRGLLVPLDLDVRAG